MQFLVFEKFTSAYLNQITRESSYYLLAIPMKNASRARYL